MYRKQVEMGSDYTYDLCKYIGVVERLPPICQIVSPYSIGNFWLLDFFPLKLKFCNCHVIGEEGKLGAVGENLTIDILLN